MKRLICVLIGIVSLGCVTAQPETDPIVKKFADIPVADSFKQIDTCPVGYSIRKQDLMIGFRVTCEVYDQERKEWEGFPEGPFLEYLDKDRTWDPTFITVRGHFLGGRPHGYWEFYSVNVRRIVLRNDIDFKTPGTSSRVTRTYRVFDEPTEFTSIDEYYTALPNNPHQPVAYGWFNQGQKVGLWLSYGAWGSFEKAECWKYDQLRPVWTDYTEAAVRTRSCPTHIYPTRLL